VRWLTRAALRRSSPSSAAMRAWVGEEERAGVGDGDAEILAAGRSIVRQRYLLSAPKRTVGLI
jgi:ribosomal protein L27